MSAIIQYVTSLSAWLTARRRGISLFFLSTSYPAGIIGIGFNIHPLFIYLTPFSLLLSFSLLLWNHRGPATGLVRFLVVGGLLAFFTEAAGVATGLIFGRYAYGEVLGFKWLDTPLLIAVNWTMLAYIANEVSGRMLPENTPRPLAAAVAALIPALLDVCIEPVAIRYGMWHWYGQQPPLQNYTGWYILGFVISLGYQYWIGRQRNAVAPLLLALQALFFGVLLVL